MCRASFLPIVFLLAGFATAAPPELDALQNEYDARASRAMEPVTARCEWVR